MIEIIICRGIPASGKSTWAKEFVAQDPDNWVRINNDELRSMMNGSAWSKEYEKIIVQTRLSIIREALKHDKNVILDNLNLTKKSWDDTVKIAKQMNKNITITERNFYIDLKAAIERDSLRSKTARVGESVIKLWWNKGGRQLKNAEPKTEILVQRGVMSDRHWSAMVQDTSLPKAVIFDNDGTISLVHEGRGPYDASTCDMDHPHEHVIECMDLYFKAGYKIIFLSGREEKDRAPTERFYKKHFPHVAYELYMRQSGDKRKDVLIKEEIFNEHIKNKYNVRGWYDDRGQVVEWIYQSGLPLFRVSDPFSSF